MKKTAWNDERIAKAIDSCLTVDDAKRVLRDIIMVSKERIDYKNVELRAHVCALQETTTALAAARARIAELEATK